MVIRSYVRSTDDHRKPCGEYIFPGIDVAVDTCCSAIRTIPGTNVQRQLLHHKPAFVTSFTAREESVNRYKCSSVPIAFIFKLTKHLRPCSIANTKSKLTVTNHISNSQVFNSNQAIVTNQVCRQLVQKISTSIFDVGVYLGYFKSRFRSVIRVFGFPTQFLLRYFKPRRSPELNSGACGAVHSALLIQPIKMLWVGYFFSVAGSQQTRDANINAHFFISWWQRLNSRVIYQQRNKPSSRWLKFDCNGRWANALWHSPRPNNIQWFSALSKPQISIFSI